MESRCLQASRASSCWPYVLHGCVCLRLMGELWRCRGGRYDREAGRPENTTLIRAGEAWATGRALGTRKNSRKNLSNVDSRRRAQTHAAYFASWSVINVGA